MAGAGLVVDMVRSARAARRCRGVAVVPVRLRDCVADGHVFTGPELHAWISPSRPGKYGPGAVASVTNALPAALVVGVDRARLPSTLAPGYDGFWPHVNGGAPYWKNDR
jgi:hypothetical protein